MSSTVLRVKRRLEDNPQDALVLVCKRIKTDADAGISPSLFVFRGTVENQVRKVENSPTTLKITLVLLGYVIFSYLSINEH